MKRVNHIAIGIIMLLSTISCKNYYDSLMRSPDPEYRLKGAFEYYYKGKFKKAADLFEGLILPYQGTPQEDTVQFYTALCNYKFGDYQTAETGFEKFVEVFPRSPFTEDARYMRIKCLYDATYRYELDQVPTKKAMILINEFIVENPESPYNNVFETYLEDLQERLYKKSFESARLYYNVEDYKAAHYALKNVLREDSDNIYREDIMYYTVLAAYKYAFNSVASKQKERYLTFIDDYYTFIGEYPESLHARELHNLYKKVQKLDIIKQINNGNGEQE